MLYTEDFSMRHYVGFSQIGSHMLTNAHTSMLLINFRQAPLTAGVYEARYYPYALNSNKTGKRHDVYWMKAKFTVIRA